MAESQAQCSRAMPTLSVEIEYNAGQLNSIERAQEN